MNLNNVIARAQRMMLDENFQRDVERAARAQRGSGMRGNGGNDLADLDAAIFGVSSAPQGTDIYQKVPIQEAQQYRTQNNGGYDGIQIVQEVREQRNPNSKVPSIIRESFEKVPFQGDAFDISGGALSGLMLEQTPKQAPRQQQVQQQMPQNYGGINADLLKYIVTEAVKDVLKGQLNESVGGSNMKGFRIAPGNMIQFIDTNGNLYEGKLTLKKRAK